MQKKLSIEDRIARALRQIIRGIDLHSRSLLQRYGLTAPQLATLLEIERLQPVSAGTLANEIHLGSATLTGVLDRLEERGLVCRTRHAGDRRSVLLTLTDRGTQLFASAPSQLCESLTRSLSALPEWEQTSILSTLQRVAHMMDPGNDQHDSVETHHRLSDSGEFPPIQVPGADGAAACDQSNPSVPSA